MKIVPILAIVLLAVFVPCAIAASPADERASLTLQVPYGSTEPRSLAVPGGNLTGFVAVESYYQGISNVSLAIEMPAGVRLKGPSTFEFSLMAEYDSWFQILNISMDNGLKPGTYPINVSAVVTSGNTTNRLERQAWLRVVTEEELSRILVIDSVSIPSDVYGISSGEYEPDTLVLKPTLPLVKSFFKDRHENPVPRTYATVSVENRGDDNVVVIVTYAIRDLNGYPVSGLNPPSQGAATDFIYGTAVLKPHSRDKLILPVYADEDVVLGGTYLGRATLGVIGSSTQAAVSESKIKVVSENWTAVIVTSAAALATLGLCTVLIGRNRQLFGGLKTRDIVMIALFGTVAFASINVPMAFLWELSSAVLGPFSFFFTGIFYSVIWYSIVVALVVLIPKPGVISLLMAVRFILNGFMFGQFTPTILISYGFQTLLIEIVLYASGVTRYGVAGRGLAMVALLVLADAISSFVSFNIWIFLYRLFYANWYLGLNILVNGVLYTAAGVMLGLRLGDRLRRVVD